MDKTAETTPRGLPPWLALVGWVLLPGALLLNARLVWEQTFLTWRQGPQMVGYSLSHLHPELVIVGLLLVMLAHLWLLSAAGMIIVKKRLAFVTKWHWLLIGLIAGSLGVGYVPYDWWKILVIHYPKRSPHLAEFLPERLSEAEFSP